MDQQLKPGQLSDGKTQGAQNMTSDLSVAVNENGAAPKTRAKDYQLECLAQMAVMGLAPDRMAAETDLPDSYINYHLYGYK